MFLSPTKIHPGCFMMRLKVSEGIYTHVNFASSVPLFNLMEMIGVFI